MKSQGSYWRRALFALAFLAGTALCSSKQVSAYSTYEFVVENCTWSQAFQKCLDKGGHLVRMETEDEYLEVVRQLEADQSLRNKVFYIAGGRSKKNSNYYWLDDNMKLTGQPLNSGGSWAQKYWFSGEPSLTDLDGTVENVMSIFKYRGSWGLNDEPNDVLKAAPEYSGIVGYIVEYEDISMGSSTYDTPSGSGQYILPSDERRLTEADISGLSPQELCYARNEIYARKGRIFRSQELRDYFGQFSWYHGTMTADQFDDNALLNQNEKNNLKLILDYEKSRYNGGYTLDQPGYRISNVKPTVGGPVSSSSSSVPGDTVRAMLSGKIVELGSSFTLDLNQDGTPENVSLRIEERDYVTYGYVRINGQEGAMAYSEFPDESLYGTSLDGKTILILSHDNGPSDDDVTEFWRYSGGIEWAGVIEDTPKNMKIADGVLYAHTRFMLVGTLAYQSLWQYSGGSIVPVQRSYYKVYNYVDDYYSTLDYGVTVYINKDMSSETFTMKPQDVRFTYTDGERWVFIEGRTGQKGWFPAGDYGGSINNYFSGLLWAD